MFFEKYAAAPVIIVAMIYSFDNDTSNLLCLIKMAGTINAVKTAGAIKLMNFTLV